MTRRALFSLLAAPLAAVAAVKRRFIETPRYDALWQAAVRGTCWPKREKVIASLVVAIDGELPAAVLVLENADGSLTCNDSRLRAERRGDTWYFDSFNSQRPFSFYTARVEFQPRPYTLDFSNHAATPQYSSNTRS
jgi:hypothetical protein